MQIYVLTLFPDMFLGPLDHSMVKRAKERGLVEVHIRNIRDYAQGKHRQVDDTPYSGGPGMVLKPEPIFYAVEAVLEELKEKERDSAKGIPVILFTPQGRRFDQDLAKELATCPAMVLICGHYEGVDERVCQHLVTHEISIGDYVLTGGELPAMVVSDAVVRLVPGALGCSESASLDSLATGLLQYPQYTRPLDFRGWGVPPVLLSGDHEEVRRWRREQSLLRTLQRRPDLLEKASLSQDDQDFLSSSREEP